jgi:hypothetical protein
LAKNPVEGSVETDAAFRSKRSLRPGLKLSGFAPRFGFSAAGMAIVDGGRRVVR